MKTTLLGLGFALLLFCFNTPQNCQAAALPAASSGANNNQYTCKPPFLASAAKPNIHFVLDVTGSMAEHVYVTQSQVYVPDTNYYGLYKNNIYYTYSAANGRWEEQPNTTCTMTDLIGGTNCISGNLLNYVTTNKMDIVRKILTGGRTLTGDTTVLEHEQANSSGNIGGVGEPTTGCTFDTSANAGKLFISSGTVSTSIKSSNVNKITKTKNGFTLTRTDLGSFVADGWKPGMTFTTNGFNNNGTWTIAAGGVAIKVLTLTTSTGNSNTETKQATLTGPTIVSALNCAYITEKTSAGTMTVNQTTKKFIRSDAGSFVTDGWLDGMQFRSTGLQNSNNGIWTIATGGVTAKEITVVETGMQTDTTSRNATFVLGLNAYVKIKSSTPTDVGLIQDFYPTLADLEISFFSTGTGIGVDYTGGGVANSNTVKNQPLANYINSINQTMPNGGTNTGPAMLAAQKFFQQDTTISATAPSSGTALINKGFGDSDPYFEPPATGAATVANSSVATCRKTFVILISDGQWNSPDTSSSSDPVWPAFAMHRRDGTNDLRINTGVGGVADKQSVNVYTVYAFGGNDVAGRNAMITTAIYGGFDDIDNNGKPYPFTNTASPFRTPSITSGTTTSLDTTNLDYPLAECDPDGINTWNAGCAEWDTSTGPTVANPSAKHTGLPYNFFEADNGDQLAASLKGTVTSIMARVASSAAASILGNNDNAGATLIQAMFYPEKQFEDDFKATWIGEVQAFWYYLDPKLDHITIRVDNGPTSPQKLVLTEDQIAEFHFDGTDTKVFQFADANGDGIKDNALTNGLPTSPDTSDAIENVSTLWRAGRSLWSRVPSDRTIFANNPTGAGAAKLDFTTTNAATLQPYMDTTVASDVIAYLRGSDTNSTYDVRQRSVKIGTVNTWKLGDVINSTPKMISEVRVNSYNLKAPGGYSDSSYDKFIKSKDYGQRGTAFVGANDGMLHAFKTGSNFIGSTQGIVAEIKNADGSTSDDLGKELWAFVPKNSLPYLQYLLLPNYKHMYYVDSTPLVVDASIGMTNPNACQRTCTNANNSTRIEPLAQAVTTNPCTTATASTYYLCARRTTLTCTDNNLSTTNMIDYSTTGTDCGTSWRTVLIGSAGLGGATSNTKAETAGVSMTVATGGTLTRTAGSFATDGWAVGKKFTAGGFANNANNSTFKISAISGTGNMITFTPTTGLVAETGVASLIQNVVKTPVSNFGYSSYFALDVSETVPQLMWEFSDPRLGFSTVTPAVMRIRDTNDTLASSSPRNGKWYAVFASGPTGPIDGPSSSFLGRSEQPLTIFVLDLKTGALVRTFNTLAPTDAFNLANQSVHTQVTSTFMPDDAFASSLAASSIDVDKASSSAPGNYSDDAAYIGYTRASVATNAEPVVSWNKGGVLRLLTYNDPNPANWKVSTVIDNIGPVTSTVTKLQDITNHKLWLFFGTGRYFVKGDDPANVQTLFGIQDPCYYSESTDNFGLAASACSTSIAASTTAAGLTSTSATTLVDKSTATVTTLAAANAALASGKKGWYINLGAASGSNYPKRVITNPVASTTGVITFTTFTPSTDVCTFGGTTSVWSVKYDTGGVGSINLKGQILIQLSTGAFQQIDVATAFTENLNRETPQYQGVPPKSEPAITTNSNHTPSKRILHIQEK
jgi:Tfp pilus tip-associated adhesin PilY1